MASGKLRVGMIGAGGISKIHCEGWAALPECELVAITDINHDAAAARAAEFKIDVVERKVADLLGRDDIDVVDIVTPNMFHKAQTIAALAAGKHVLCEKPLALTARDVDAMIAAAAKAKKKLMCAQHMRFQADSRAVKQYITKHSLGEIYYARAWYNRRRFLPCTPGFMYKRNSGGGCCIDVGVHVLDLTLHLMDNFEPVSVTGAMGTKLAKRPDSWSEWGQIDRKNIDVEDFAAGMIRFKNGAALSLECSFMLNMKPKGEFRVDLFGTEAGASWPECEVYDHTASDYVDTKISVRPSKAAPHHEEIRAFAQAVLTDSPVPVPPQQSRAVIAILEGLYKSQKTGKEVRL
ncbi:MAG: Gfo/Idh/MocA family oxidoreductase [Phycisphaerae bacterium]|nr:Gfo/Idh/MocA family oxidoreductase [Phycisphaerae bacterium]